MVRSPVKPAMRPTTATAAGHNSLVLPPRDTGHVGSKLGHRRRRWSNFEPTRLVLRRHLQKTSN